MTTPHRIALVTRGKILAGAERQMLYLAQRLDRGQFDPYVVTFFDGPVAATAREMGIPTSIVPRRGRQMWEDPTLPIRLAARLRTIHPEVVYAWLGEANVFASVAVCFLPDTRLLLSERGSTNGRNRIANVVLGLILSRRSDRLIANSEAGARFARACGVPRSKVVVIPNGVPERQVALGAHSTACLRQDLGIEATTRVVLSVGRLWEQKGHATLLRALATVASNRPDVVLLVAGEGGLRQSLEALSARLGLADRVRWLGQRSDVPELLDISHLAVLSSHDGEGLSNFLIEALLSGRRVIASDVGGTAEVLNGTDGLLVPPHEPDRLAAAILDALDCKDGPDAAEARRVIARQRFGLDAYVLATERTLASVLAKSAGSRNR